MKKPNTLYEFHSADIADKQSCESGMGWAGLIGAILMAIAALIAVICFGHY